MNEEDQQSNSSQSAPEEESVKNFVNQPGYQKGIQRGDVLQTFTDGMQPQASS